MKTMFRVAYNTRTHRAKDWSAARVDECEVVALFAPGLNVGRMAGALRLLAEALEKYPDPNGMTPSPPVARYAAEEVQSPNPNPRAGRIAPTPRAGRNIAPTIG